ncbi:MAG: FAD-binding oxidoreductase [Steroidobacteraceae bacterium]
MPQAIEDRPLPPMASAALRAIVGSENVLESIADRFAYARDRLPWGLFQLRVGQLPATLPAAIISPASSAELQRIVESANRLDLRLIPFGAGSGVLGGTLPLSSEVMVDLKRMNRIIGIDEIDGTVRVQAGMNGGQFEAALAARGFTANHLPQSIHMSTVGGWAACRGAGQASSRYGKIEDIVIGLNAILPDGRTLEVRPVARRAVGPSIKDLLIGSEGIFGFITDLTLRITRLPEYAAGAVYAFPNLQSGFDAMREIVQREGRPSVMRLYDEAESKARTEGIAAFNDRPILGILKFSGPHVLALAERALAHEICLQHSAITADDAPYRHWESTRYQSYSIKWQTAGYCMDTVEVTGTWRALPQMHARMRQAVRSLHAEAHFGAHWSHIYPEGACQYMTVRLPPLEHAKAMQLHREAWRKLEVICLELGGSIAHHHGVGVFRNEWLRAELGAGLDMLQILKEGIDPKNLLNPGKVGMRAAPGAAVVPASDSR